MTTTAEATAATTDATPHAATHAAETMSRAHRAYVIAMCAIIGGAFAYAACDWAHWPRLLYLPVQGRLALDAHGAIAIHYFGLVLWGIAGTCTGAMLGAALCRLRPRTWSAQTYRLFGAWAITALALGGGYFTWNLWPW
jgi:hypothetical protein